MKSIVKYYILSFLLLSTVLIGHTQIVFQETFGQTTTRTTSTYMPSGSFGWGDPNGTTDQKAIDNNYYAVIAPANIRDAYPVPYWWFWTGPEPIGNTWGGGGNPATTDHTGDANGAVMVVNAGSVLNGFYSRRANVVGGACYKLSLWFYLVNTSSSFNMQVRDAGTHIVLGTLSSGSIYTEDTWQQFSFTFKMPSGCPSNQVEVYIANTTSAFSGNDYYIDDIVLERITCGSESDIICPTSVLPVSLTNFTTTQVADQKALVEWKTDFEQGLKLYSIEHSIDGVNYTVLRTVEPQNTSTPTSYSELINIPYLSSVGHFLRLRIQELDGKVSYSKTNLLRWDTETKGLLIYPQPSMGMVTVSIPNGYEKANIQLLNSSGMVLKKWNQHSSTSLVITNLKSGMYFIRVEGAIPLVKGFIVQ